MKRKLSKSQQPAVPKQQIVGRLELSTSRLNGLGISRIEEVLGIRGDTVSADYIAAIFFDSVRVAAFPISTLNPSAPPSLSIVRGGKVLGGVDNREPTSKILKALSPHCDSAKLSDAVKLIKKALQAISS